MKRFLMTVAVLGLFACVSSAQEPTPATAPPTTAPVVVGAPGTTYLPATTAQPARRGLLARFRNRGTTTYSAPVVTTPTAPVTPGTPGTAVPPPAPMPMPGTTTGLRTISPNPMPIVVAGGTLPPGTYTTTDGTIIRVSGTSGQMVTTAGYEQPTRRGLFSRMRSR